MNSTREDREKSESSKDSERTESEDETSKKIREELKERPAITEQRKKWEKILDECKGKEKRIKAKQDGREKERQEQQRETTKRLNLTKIQR